MKAHLVFICLLLPFGLCAQMMFPAWIFSDSRSMALGENLSAGRHYAVIDSLNSSQSWQWQSYMPYMQIACWQNTCSYQYQDDSRRYRVKAAHLGRQALCLAAGYEHRLRQHWQGGIGLHLVYDLQPRNASLLMDYHWLYLPDESWQIHVLTWQCLSKRAKQLLWQAGFHVAGCYTTEHFDMTAAIDYHGKLPLMTHYGLLFRRDKQTWALGCSFPQARPSAGWSWTLAALAIETAISYDWHLGCSVQFGVCYRYGYD